MEMKLKENNSFDFMLNELKSSQKQRIYNPKVNRIFLNIGNISRIAALQKLKECKNSYEIQTNLN
jgi:hypothetical protein